MKALETESFTQEEADRAAGMGSYVAPKKFVIKTQPTKEELAKLYEQEENKNILIWKSIKIWKIILILVFNLIII